MPTQPESYIYTFSEGYYPDQVLQGPGIPGSAYSGANAVFENNGYSRAFGGWGDVGETNAPDVEPYTAAVSLGSSNVVLSAGATATTDFVEFQHLLLGRQLHLIEQIVDDLNLVISRLS